MTIDTDILDDIQAELDGSDFLDTSEVSKEEEDLESILKQSRLLAIDWIDLFFYNKPMHCGGPISAGFLHAPAYVERVLNTEISIATQLVYIAMEIENGAPYLPKLGGISDDVQWVIVFLRHCESLEVPPCFIGGLMLMYIELCEGMPIPNGAY